MCMTVSNVQCVCNESWIGFNSIPIKLVVHYRYKCLIIIQRIVNSSIISFIYSIIVIELKYIIYITDMKMFK